MKNKLLLNSVCLLAIFLMAACSNDVKEFEQQGNAEGLKTFTSFTATLDDVTGTRAYLSDTSSEGLRQVFWEEGDVISVYSDTDTELKEYKLTSISEDNQATFSGEMVTGNQFYAVFAPGSEYSVDADDHNIVHFNDFILSHKDELTFTGPMVATTSGNVFGFKQTTGLIRISVGNIHQMGEVVLETNNNDVIGMSGIVNLSESQPALNPDGYYSALHIGGAWLQLDDSQADIYFVIAPTVLENGFSVTIYGEDAQGNEIEVTKSYNSRLQVKAGTISSFSLVDVNAELQAMHEGKEAYAVLNGNKLTFYYDREKANREGVVYMYDDIIRSYGTEFGDNKESIHYAAFDSSFANNRPTSTAALFAELESLEAITDIENLNTSNVTDMFDMFSGCSSLTSLDVSGFDTSNVTDMFDMFTGCSSLTSLDLSKFDTSNVTDMSCMFYGCSSLTILDLSGFDTSNVTDMFDMFYICSSLTSLDVSGFDTSNVTDMSRMFYGCSSLTSLDVSGFDTSKVTDMLAMFSGCSSLTSLDVSGFDTSKVTDMFAMFSGCSSLTSLDLSSWDTSMVTNMRNMFRDCSSLKTIYAADWNNIDIEESSYMFEYCNNLVGGKGSTIEDCEHCDITAAHIDGGADNPGLFTAKGQVPGNDDNPSGSTGKEFDIEIYQW